MTKKDRNAVNLGRRGGIARARALSPERRKEISESANRSKASKNKRVEEAPIKHKRRISG
jgi:hypothetical protein